MSSKSAKKAGKKAAKGSQAELDLIRESRDLARSDTRHTRQAGATALNAMMRMTGLTGGMEVQYDQNGWPVQQGAPQQQPNLALEDPRFNGRVMRNPADKYGSGYQGRAAGGPMQQGTMYNVNEYGPENVYSGGSVTRNPNPMTIDGQTGYVEPNIEGRGLGGFLKKLANPLSKTSMGGALSHIDPVAGHYLAAQDMKRSGGNKPQPTAIQPTGQTDIDTTQGMDYQFQTDPGYQFRFEEGQRALDRGAAARGGLLSGGYGRKAMRYGQGFASNEYTNVYNRIANIAGMGQTANQHAGNAAMQGGFGMGNAASNIGNASAYGDQLSGNAWANAGNQIAQLPWGQMWGGSPTGNTTPTVNTWNG
jgi:hypothetical protein